MCVRGGGGGACEGPATLHLLSGRQHQVANVLGESIDERKQLRLQLGFGADQDLAHRRGKSRCQISTDLDQTQILKKCTSTSRN